MTIQTSLADILEQNRTPWENTIGKYDPILQTRNMKLKKTVQFGQGHFASDIISSSSQILLLFLTQETQHPPNVSIR